MKRFAGLAIGVFALCAIVLADNALLINGAGATFPYPIYSKWFDVYHTKNPNFQFNYQSVGSGAGIKQVTEGTVDFGATDGPDERRSAEGVPRQARLWNPSFSDGAGRRRADLQHSGSNWSR